MEYWTIQDLIVEHGSPEELRDHMTAETYIKTRIGQLQRRDHTSDSWADDEIQLLIQLTRVLRYWKAAKYDKRYLPC